MPAFSKFVLPVFFLVLFVGAMILGPLLYFALSVIYPVPFHRAMDRALLVSAVIALSLFWSRIPLKQLWPWNNVAWKELLFGYLMAAVSAQLLLGIILAMDGFTSATLTAGQIEGRLLTAFIAALIVPLLEETIFRGFIQTELVKSLGWRAGWIGAAAIFMLAHFIKIPSEIDQQPVQLWSGVAALGAAFQPVLNGDFLDGKGLNLFLIGLILGGVFLRSGTLWLNAGLHSGWILLVFLYTGFTTPSPNRYFMSLSGDILFHPFTSLVLVMLGYWLWRYYRNPSIVPETGVNAP